MEADHRSPALQSLGVRTWRGAAVFGVQVFGSLLLVLAGLKLVGPMLGIESINDKPWSSILLFAFGPAAGIFVAVALIATVQQLAKK